MSKGVRALSPGPSWSILADPDQNDTDSSLAFSSDSSDTEEPEVDQLFPSTADKTTANDNSLKRPKQSALNFLAQKRVRTSDGAFDVGAINPTKRRIATKSVPFRITNTVMSSKDQELLQSPSKSNRSQRKKPSFSKIQPRSPTSSSFSPPPLDQLGVMTLARTKPGDTLGATSKSLSSSDKRQKHAAGHAVLRTPKQSLQTTRFLGSIEISSSSSEEDCGTTLTHRKPGATRAFIEISSDSEDEETPEAGSSKARNHHQFSGRPETIQKAAPKPTFHCSSTSRKSSLFFESKDTYGTDSSNVYVWDVNIAGTRSNFDKSLKPTSRRNNATELALEVSGTRRSGSGSSKQPSASSFNPHTPKIFEKSCAFFGHNMPSHAQSSLSSPSCSSRPASNRGFVTEKDVIDFLQSCTKPRPKPRKIQPRRQSANGSDGYFIKSFPSTDPLKVIHN